MANEIQVDYSSGNTLYTVIRNITGNVWYVAGQVFETLTDKSGSRYVGNFDANIPAGRYSIQTFLQAGANPADGDTFVTSEEIVWSGMGKVTADKILVNKAVQAKSTGQIKYYDDDGQTILLIHTPTDTEANLIRTPS